MGRLTERNNDGTVFGVSNVSYMSYDEITAIFDKLAHYEDLEEQGRLIELPCKKVFRIINGDSPKYAFVDSIPIEMMPVYEIKQIDNGNVFFSTKEKAEAKLKELEK